MTMVVKDTVGRSSAERMHERVRQPTPHFCTLRAHRYLVDGGRELMLRQMHDRLQKIVDD